MRMMMQLGMSGAQHATSFLTIHALSALVAQRRFIYQDSLHVKKIDAGEK